MKLIKPTNHRLLILVDDEDYELLSENNWQINPETMAVQRCERVAGKVVTILMARVVVNAPKGVKVDHRNHNTFDNQKDNLRLASRSQNGANRRKQTKPSTSKFKGVYQFPSGQVIAQIAVNGKHIYLGSFKTHEAAAAAYDAAAVQQFGDFAFTNL